MLIEDAGELRIKTLPSQLGEAIKIFVINHVVQHVITTPHMTTVRNAIETNALHAFKIKIIRCVSTVGKIFLSSILFLHDNVVSLPVFPY